ncbi:MAG TPA: hypothetical protein VJ720_10705 [Chitinophaga sp.]|nr:hypothetical protein [Chitinophaga sp.]
MKTLYSLLLLLSCLPSIAQNTSDSLQANVDSLFETYTRSNAPGVTVLIIKDGKVVLRKGYGIAKRDH